LEHLQAVREKFQTITSHLKPIMGMSAATTGTTIPEERGFLLAIRNSNPPQRVPEER
jgi:hypothetical protein